MAFNDTPGDFPNAYVTSGSAAGVYKWDGSTWVWQKQ
jgi:hypothetical protein